MEDVTISFKIPSEKVEEYITHYLYLCKNTEKNPDGSQKYTDAQWVKEHIIRGVKRRIVDGRNEKIKDDIIKYNVTDIE